MPRCLVLLFCLFTLLAHASENQRDLAYSLGVRLGERLREEVPDLQLQALLDGLRQAYRSEPLRLEEKRIEQILAEHEAQQADSPASAERAITAERRFLANEKAKAGVRELPGGVLRIELQRGHGSKPKATSKVQVLYVGRLADGSVFDESAEPQWFRLDSVITGWRTALQEMPVGTKWRLVIPAAQAYGADGAGDLIPPYAPLVFELELLGTAD
ncbi:FKBP-type peptidyl-prolyl cis-trans isomerase [Pseudomonas cavernicola]|uniref:Peptidyl-prolyl cis-trans isomerase n=1 Tax=Pseudomonas cavernicola TaxID=2320866 RepID=A0A418XKF6_9PSED|nr:FKBP-type peptidyl-prolyl cis-trans isomerase [Pseudomonas cavernicola]RJG12969.1 FKBP-type peptidyl-prolyl cis-trans isomerase [Pseudomonas cavernicola]